MTKKSEFKIANFKSVSDILSYLSKYAKVTDKDIDHFRNKTNNIFIRSNETIYITSKAYRRIIIDDIMNYKDGNFEIMLEDYIKHIEDIEEEPLLALKDTNIFLSFNLISVICEIDSSPLIIRKGVSELMDDIGASNFMLFEFNMEHYMKRNIIK